MIIKKNILASVLLVTTLNGIAPYLCDDKSNDT